MPQMKSVEKTLMMAFAGAIAASFCCGLSVAPSVDKELAKALAYGADAAINVFVHDEQNHPITGACVWGLLTPSGTPKPESAWRSIC